MPLLSQFAQKKKLEYFLKNIKESSEILEIGSGQGWLKKELLKRGYKKHTNLDLVPPADIVGDIRNWRELGLKENYFDFVFAFEVVEHVHCFEEVFALLKPGGTLLLTSPVPHMDWLCYLLEVMGLNQKRTSPHDHLIYFKDIPLFEVEEIKVIAGVSQWGKLKKPQ